MFGSSTPKWSCELPLKKDILYILFLIYIPQIQFFTKLTQDACLVELMSEALKIACAFKSYM